MKDKKIIFFTGAGISAESGVSTFRDSGGLWEQYNILEVCTASSLDWNRDKTIEFYNKRRLDIKDKKPNKAHITITNLQNKYPNNIKIVTQNVDDLFEKAYSDIAVMDSIVKNDVVTHMTAFHAQQCIEKSLKAILEHEGQAVPKKHDILMLKDAVKNYISIEDEDTLDDINDLYIDSRYPGSFGYFQMVNQLLKMQESSMSLQ